MGKPFGSDYKSGQVWQYNMSMAHLEQKKSVPHQTKSLKKTIFIIF